MEGRRGVQALYREKFNCAFRFASESQDFLERIGFRPLGSRTCALYRVTEPDEVNDRRRNSASYGKGQDDYYRRFRRRRRDVGHIPSHRQSPCVTEPRRG
jgi:hypothetical protein